MKDSNRKVTIMKNCFFVIKKWLLVSIIISSVSCRNGDFQLFVENNSLNDIVFHCSEDSIYDTIKNGGIGYLLSLQKINPLCSRSVEVFGVYGKPDEISKSMYGYLFEYDTLKKYRSMKYIIENKLYRMYVLSEDILKMPQWIIEYPHKEFQLKVINKSQSDIVYGMSDSIYDTINSLDVGTLLYNPSIKPFCTSVVCFAGLIGRPKSMCQGTYVYVFVRDTLKKYLDIKYILENKLYTKYKLSEEILNTPQWTIEYPPKELLCKDKDSHKKVNDKN